MKQILFSIFCILLMSVIFAEAGISDKNDKLIQSAETGNLQGVQTALAEGADINERDSDNATALLRASQNGLTEVVKLLFIKGLM